MLAARNHKVLRGIAGLVVRRTWRLIRQQSGDGLLTRRLLIAVQATSVLTLTRPITRPVADPQPNNLATVLVA